MKKERIKEMLTTKELSAIEDQMNAEKVLIAKYEMYAQQTNDTALKTKLNQAASMHRAHMEKLFTLLG